MKIKKSNSSKNTVVIIASIVGVILLLAVLYTSFNTQITNFLTSSDSETTEAPMLEGTPAVDTPATNEQVSDGETIKKETIEKDQAEQTEDGNTAVVITRATQSEDGTIVQIRTLIETVTSGTCNLSIKNGGDLFETSVATQPLASTSTCRGFDVPLNELGSGEWNISIRFSNSNSQGAASTVLEVR